MTRLKRRYRILCWFLAACLLVGAVGLVYLHGEWWYPLLERLERKTPLEDLL